MSVLEIVNSMHFKEARSEGLWNRKKYWNIPFFWTLASGMQSPVGSICADGRTRAGRGGGWHSAWRLPSTAPGCLPVRQEHPHTGLENTSWSTYLQKGGLSRWLWGPNWNKDHRQTLQLGSEPFRQVKSLLVYILLEHSLPCSPYTICGFQVAPEPIQAIATSAQSSSSLSEKRSNALQRSFEFLLCRAYYELQFWGEVVQSSDR